MNTIKEDNTKSDPKTNENKDMRLKNTKVIRDNPNVTDGFPAMSDQDQEDAKTMVIDATEQVPQWEKKSEGYYCKEPTKQVHTVNPWQVK